MKMFKDIISKIKEARSPETIKQSQNMILFGMIAFFLIGAVIYSSLKSKPRNTHLEQSQIRTEKTTVIEPQEIINDNSIIHESLETKIENTQSKFQSEIGSLKNELKNANEAIIAQKEEIKSMLDLLTTLTAQLKNNQESMLQEQSEIQQIQRIRALKGGQEEHLKPKDPNYYIADTTFVKGVLLGGVYASTSEAAQLNPEPVLIRIDDYGKLPRGVRNNLMGCRVRGSAIGKLASERVMIRLEKLVCTDVRTKRQIETKVVGHVTGHDSAPGVRAEILSVNQRLLRNAAIGSLISGLSNIVRVGSGNTIYSRDGAIVGEHESTGDLFKQGIAGGASKSADRISEYYLKQAEMLYPVAYAHGGQEVDVVFDDGVFIDTGDIPDRVKSNSRTYDSNSLRSNNIREEN